MRVRLLGRFEVQVESRVVREDVWRLRKAAGLVKLLALASGHRLHREQVMDLLWPELNAKAAANNLHHVLHVARRTLEPSRPASSARYLRLRGEQVFLGPDGVWTDVEAFEEAAITARRVRAPAAYRAAVDLYAGDLLPRDLYEDWTEPRRTGLRGTYLALLSELAGRFPPDPPARSVRPVSDGQPASHPHNLPAGRTSFIGRERELVEVKRALAMTRLLTLTGTGGSGKTRLALELARDLVGAYPDGVWLVELASLSEPGLVPQAAATVLGVREVPGRPLVETLVHALGEKEALLVLDNCEHLVEAVARLADGLLDACPGLRILATSREPLGVAGELNRGVPPLGLPDPGHPPTVEELAACGSARLFVERASLGPAGFALTPGNAEFVAEICRRLDGIPLAIELAAARVGVLGVEQTCRRLEGSISLLTGGARTAPARQQTMHGSLDWSYELLGLSEKKLFRRLSVFAGSFSLEAAQAVGAGDGMEDAVTDVLVGLVERSLVAADAAGDGAARYRLLQPVRQYAREKLRESGEAGMARRRHALWYLALAEAAEQELQGPRQGEWLERLEAEHDDLRAALEHVMGWEEAGPALRFAGALGGFWHMRGYLSEGRRWLEAALAKGEKGDAPADTRVRALTQAAFIGWEQGDLERSVALGEESLDLSRQTGDRAGAAAALYILGFATLFREEPEKAEAMLEEAAALQRDMGDEVGLARTLQCLGLTVMVQGDFGRAEELYDEGLALARRAGDDFGVELLLLGRALSALGQDDYDRAREVCAEAVDLSLRLDYQHSTAANLHVLASVAGSRGQPVRAARLWGAAEALRETIGTPELSPVERTFYARHVAAARQMLDAEAWEAAWAEGRRLTAEQAVEYGLPADEPCPVLRDAPEAVGSVGRTRVKALAWASWIAWEQGVDLERSTRLGEEGLALARRLGDEAGVAAALLNLGIAALRHNELDQATDLLEEAREVYRELEDTSGAARAAQALGLVAVVQGEHGRARALFEEALALAREVGDRVGIVLALGLGALAAFGRGDYEDVRGLCGEGLDLARSLDMKHGIVFLLHASAVTAGARGHPGRSALLWGAAEALREHIGVGLVPVEHRYYGPHLDAARARLGDEAWRTAWAEGRKMPLERALELALSETEQATPTVPGKLSARLTRREEEVADLLLRGLTNRQIARKLVISGRTVEKHVANVLKKLGLRSRREIVVR